MDTTADPVVTPADAAQQQEGAPEQNAELAQPQTDAAPEADQSPESEGETLTDDQKTIRKLQRRIDRLTAGRGAATREAELLREQMAQLQQKPQGQDDDEPKAVSRQDIDRLANERARELHRQQTVAARADAVIKSGQKLQGFTEACNAVAEEVPFTDQQGRPTPFIEAVLDADKPAELLHWLGNNPDEAAALANLSPAQLGRRLAKLEDRLEREGKTSSKAPTPLTPVRGVGQPAKRLEDLDGDDFDKRRREQIAKRRA